MWQRIPTVWAKFLSILIPILILCTIAFTIVFFFTKYAALRHELSVEVTDIARINASGLADSLWSFDVPNTQNIIQAIAIHSDIRCIEVSDDLAGTRYIWPASGCDGFAELSSVTEQITIDGRDLGSISVSYDYGSVGSRIANEVIIIFGLLLFLLIGTIGAALIAHRVTIGVPLSRLIESIRRAETAETRTPVDWFSADELGRVIAAYNRLLEQLSHEEQALRRAESRLRMAIAATRSSVWDEDLITGDLWWSPEFPALLGSSASDLSMSRSAWESLVHPDDLAAVLDDAQQHIDGTTSGIHITYRMRCQSGDWLWVEDRATAVRDRVGRAVRITGIRADVNERVRAEQALAHERALLQATLENVDQGIAMFDHALHLVLFNRRAAELLGVPAEFLDRQPKYLDILEYQKRHNEFVDYDDDDPSGHIPYWGTIPNQPATYKRRRPDGTVLEIRSNPMFEGGYVCTYTDVTAEARSAEEIFLAMQETERALDELKETQASLVQAEKMSSLALLVAGIAHEINTPVGIAFSCASHLGNRTRQIAGAFERGGMKKSDLRGYIEVAQESSRLMMTNLTRASELIQSFKQVAVDQTSQERRQFLLHNYLDEVITSLRPRLKNVPQHVLVDCPESIVVNTYPGALSQILTNLVMNALVHAFEDGEAGTISIDVGVFENSDVRLEFADDGKGIPPYHLGKVFEPFFTTRRGAGGSGLGLHIVFNLVTQSLGGRITVDSALGVGTTFHLRFPREAPTRTEPPTVSQAAKGAA